jgi:hypothetical protein
MIKEFLLKIFNRPKKVKAEIKESDDKAKTEAKETDDMVVFARAIEKLMDETSLEVFSKYNEILLAESNVYIVPAVWGAVKDGELTPVQKEIHSRIAPVINKILDSLYQENLSAAQRFAIGYLVRGLFISKIIYMIEFYRNLSGIRAGYSKEKSSLEDIETVGHA